MTVRDDLRKLDEFFSSPFVWTKRAIARDSDGELTTVDDPEAVRFCLMGGACKTVEDFDDRWVLNDALRDVLPKEYGGSLSAFNDQNDFAAVKALIRRAICTSDLQAPA